MAEKSAPSKPAPTPLAAAADRIRGSAQWIIAAFAAVGAVLAAGLQIASIGDLTLDDPVRFWCAVGGVALAVAGIVMAVAAATKVTAQTDVSLKWLDDPDNATSLPAITVAGDATLLQGLTIKTLRSRLEAGATELGELYDEATSQQDTDLSTYQQALARQNRLRQIQSDVLDVAGFYRVQEAFGKAKTQMVISAVIAAIGISGFAWGVNEPDPSGIDSGEILPKTPSEVTVVLNDVGTAAFGDQIRQGGEDDCDLQSIDAIAFDVDHDSYDIVTVKTEHCSVVRFELSAEHGDVIPRRPAE